MLVALAVLFVPAMFFDWLVLSPYRLFDNLTSILGVLLIGVFALTRLRSLSIFRMPALLGVLYLLGTMIAAAAHATTLQPAELTRELQTYFQFFQAGVLFVVLVDIFRDRRAVSGAVVAFFLSCLVMSLMTHAGMGLTFVSVGELNRVGVQGVNLNQQAFRYGLAVLGVCGWCLSRWPRLRSREWLLLGCAMSMLLALVRTGSRGGVVMLAVGLVLGLGLFARRRLLGAYVTFVPVLVVSVLAVVLRTPVVEERFSQIEEGQTGMRMELNRSAWEMFKERPLVGWGGSYIDYLGQEVGLNKPIATHNTYTQVLVAFGLAGFLPWALMVGLPGWRLWRARKHPLLATTFMLYGSTLVFAAVGNEGYGKTFAILLALIVVLPRMAQQPLQVALAPPKIAEKAQWRLRARQRAVVS